MKSFIYSIQKLYSWGQIATLYSSLVLSRMILTLSPDAAVTAHIYHMFEWIFPFRNEH